MSATPSLRRRLAASRRLIGLSRGTKRTLAVLSDAGLCALATWMAFGLRLDLIPAYGSALWIATGSSIAIALPMFLYFGLYRAIFRYAGWAAMIAVLRAVALYGVAYAALFAFISVPGVPRTVGVIQPILLLLGAAGMRIVARYWLGGFYRANRRQVVGARRVLIYGAGAAGRQLATVLHNSDDMVAVGFVDDDDTLQGNDINGLTVFRRSELAQIVEKFEITDVLLALPSVDRDKRNEVIDALRALSVKVRTLPQLIDLASGRVHMADLRELEVEDLLGRDPVAPNGILLNRNIRGKVVLVTGAGGSIGSELCRQIARVAPTALLLVDASEFALYQVHQELKAQVAQQVADGATPDVTLLPLLASVQDETRMEQICATWRPHAVYHAAAYKHVPLVEHNPAEGVRNNVLGTLTAARAAARHDCAHFVLISTDKAVRPTNVMGASKRLAEMVLQALAAERGTSRRGTCFSMVRFGNVLGSSGSVVPLFRQQIMDGGPITLTHSDVTRYFMTIPEAAQLVIQSSAMAGSGEVFVLDMGEPVRIVDLARRMVELSGLTVYDDTHPDGDIEITVTGLRPGEKLYEELLISDNPEPTQHPRIMKAQEAFLPWVELEPMLRELRDLLDANDVHGVLRMLERLVAGYEPADNVVDWVHMQRAQTASVGQSAA
jgi:FlaA1/EpsC-like NDP-sugar epimerase